MSTRTKKYPGKPVKTGIFLAGNILVKACKSMGIMAAIVKVWVLWLIWRPVFYKFFPGFPGFNHSNPGNPGNNVKLVRYCIGILLRYMHVLAQYCVIIVCTHYGYWPSIVYTVHLISS